MWLLGSCFLAVFDSKDTENGVDAFEGWVVGCCSFECGVDLEVVIKSVLVLAGFLLVNQRSFTF